MSAYTLTLEYRLNGVLTDLESPPLLRNEGAAFGVRESISLAIVVPAGTAMVRVAAGVYEHTIPDCAAVAHQAYAEYSAGGVVHWQEQTFTPSGAAGAADAYISQSEADAYATAEVDAAAWTALSSAQKVATLRRATDEIDSSRWQGRKYDISGAQDRAFPRVYDETLLEATGYPTRLGGQGCGVWDWRLGDNAPVVPPAVKRACWLQALSIAQGSREERLSDRHDGVSGQSAGGMSEQYAPGEMNVLCPRAWTLLKRYRLRTGRLV